MLLSLHAGDPTPAHIVVWMAIAVVLVMSARFPIEVAAIGLLLVAAVVLRLAWSDRTGSDVLSVTEAAISRVLAGQNPYGFAYPSSNPPGAPFPYGPLAVLLYLPFHHVTWLLELLSGFAVAAILAVQGRLVGLAVYGMAPMVVSIATDGSNDTTLGFLILAAFMSARRWPLAAGFLLGSAAAFKLSALAFAPGFFVWAGVRASLMFVAGSIIAWAPVLSTWGIASYLDSASRANDLHASTRWTFGVLVREITHRRIEALDQLRFVAGGLVALVGLRVRRSMDAVILVGVAVYLVTLYGGNWATFAYIGGIAPIVCWRLDDWLGFEPASVRARITALRAAWDRQRGAGVATRGDVATGDAPAL